jgi:hypothetical protein
MKNLNIKELKKIEGQLEKAKTELKELNNEDNQLVYDYVEYADILVKKLINPNNE